MEYAIGSILTLIAIYVSQKILKKSIPNKIVKRSIHSQSYFYEVVKPFVPIMDMLTPKRKIVTQASKEQDKHKIKILTYDNHAYWIRDNAVYEADIVHGELDRDSAKVLDMMGMNDVELKKIMFIVEKLTEGSQQ